VFFYWLVFLGLCNVADGQVVGPLTPRGGSSPQGRPRRDNKVRRDDKVQWDDREVRKCLVKVAMGQTHVRERTGRNDGVAIRQYLKVLNLPEGTPYCGAFVEWVFQKCGVVSNVQAPAVAYSWVKYPQRLVWNKAPVIGKKAPQAGDIAVFAWRQRAGLYKIRHHCELVVEWQDDEEVDDFVTVGGNTSAPLGIKGGEGVHKKLRDKETAVVANHLSETLSRKPRPISLQLW
jgi:CHAP domain